MKRKSLLVIYFLFFPGTIYCNVREHFVIGWSRGTFHLFKKRELHYSWWEYERFHPYNWYDIQIYPRRRIGLQIQYGRQKHEIWRENTLKQKLSEELKHFLFLNLIYKFPIPQKLKISPFILMGAGYTSLREEPVLESVVKMGGGIKYFIFNIRKEKKVLLFFNLNLGIFWCPFSIKGSSNHWDFQYGFEAGF